MITEALITGVATGMAEALATHSWVTIRNRVHREMGPAGQQLLEEMDRHHEAIMALDSRERRSAALGLLPEVQDQLQSLVRDHEDAVTQGLTNLGTYFNSSHSPRSAMTQTIQGSGNLAAATGQGNINQATKGGHIGDNKKVSFGGLVAIAAVIIVVLIFVGKMASSVLGGISGPSITADSTCGDWLRADQSTQYQSAMNIAVERNSPEKGDPFIVQNIQYDCQNNTDTKLRDIIKPAQ
ncbi:hypothetical protein [Streptomyces xylophagus]|uniref:hypothetical protein n=1 Tax=Streptomyces xylophagus TaxID=285514 RepID=UPI0005B997B3|nr:hypothetical protein [Streptomyces xylophagus]